VGLRNILGVTVRRKIPAPVWNITPFALAVHSILVAKESQLTCRSQLNAHSILTMYIQNIKLELRN
jgi:hypothetical protein